MANLDVGDVLREVEWPTLVVLHGPVRHGRAASSHTGVIHAIGTWSLELFGDNYFARRDRVAVRLGDPRRVRRQHPLRRHDGPSGRGHGSRSPDPATGQALWWAFALGADFGGNGTAVAASANVVAIGMAARSGYPISFWQFTRYGIIVTILSVILAWVYVWLRYF